MRKTIWTGTCTAIVGFATAAMMAQAPQTPQTPQTPPTPQTSAASSEGKVTVTGCLKTAPPDAPASAAATPPASGANAPGDAKFLLTDATSTPAAATDSSAAPTQAPQTATPSAAQTGSTYRLIANPSALTPHVGKKLALTGTIENSSAASTPGTSPASRADSAMLALRVESGKIIADTCTGGQ
jgi:hypothetical protein